jgi:aldehyde dehydrogenase (NAD+)
VGGAGRDQTPAGRRIGSILGERIDVDHALAVARQLPSGSVGHNAYRGDFTMAFGGFKQSGVGREGGRDGLREFFETKSVILNSRPSGYENAPV